MESRFTPGPWHVAINPGGPENQPAFPSVRDNTGNPHGEDIVCMPLGDSEAVTANANLIAAAPEMFEAWEMALATLDETDMPIMRHAFSMACSKARAAIAKARGE